MNRLHFWLTAKTQYNLNSPFLFRLYNEVLFARVAANVPHPDSTPYEKLVYKFSDHFQLRTLSANEEETLLEGTPRFGRVLILNKPHANKKQEERLEKLTADPRYKVALDLYHSAVFLTRPGIARQSYRLK